TGTDSTAAATEPSTAPSGASPSTATTTTPPPSTTSPNAPPPAAPAPKSSEASNATSPDPSTGNYNPKQLDTTHKRVETAAYGAYRNLPFCAPVLNLWFTPRGGAVR